MILPLLFAVIAALFACVGQAGGVGYIAAVGLFGYSAATIKIAALALTPVASGLKIALG